MAKIVTIIFLIAILLTVSLNLRAEAQAAENMETFFDSEVPGIRIIVNATSETQPNGNVSVRLGIYPLVGVEVNVTRFSFTIYGYDHGEVKTPVENKTKEPFSPPLQYNFNFTVPGNVWGTMYGEIRLTYVAETQIAILPIKDLKCGFPMTVVENVAFKKLQEDYKKLNESYGLLNNSYWQLRKFYEELNQTFFKNFQMNLTLESLAALNNMMQQLQGAKKDLENTRTVAAILTVTTFIFVASTIYLTLRRPKEFY